MAKRNIVWTRTADLQLIGVLEYWVKRNKSSDYSKKLLRLVTERTVENIAARKIKHVSTTPHALNI